jgi:hypothetical protein
VAAVDEAWKTADPYSFLPKPEDNFNVHEELPFSDGHIERYANTRAELAKHLERTGGKVWPLEQFGTVCCMPFHVHLFSLVRQLLFESNWNSGSAAHGTTGTGKLLADWTVGTGVGTGTLHSIALCVR